MAGISAYRYGARAPICDFNEPERYGLLRPNSAVSAKAAAG
jgi:hypothetical protein